MDQEAVTVERVFELPPEGKALLEGWALPLPAGNVPREFGVLRSERQVMGVVGLEWYHPHALLRSLAVRSGWERRGLGTILAHWALERFREEGGTDLYLLTTTAAGFFLRLGFLPITRDEVPARLLESEEFAVQCPATATVMRLDRQRLETIRHYDQAARCSAQPGRDASGKARAGLDTLPMAGGGCCCSGTGCGCGEESGKGSDGEAHPHAKRMDSDVEAIPSWGCTLNPLFGEPSPGEVVLDLGCGAGRNALKAAERVGPDGHVYGLDLSPAMLAEAERHRQRLGLANVSFLQAPMEAVTLPDGCVDLVMSDCVLNLSTDKARALKEAYRVLKPGGRLAIADVVRVGPKPDRITMEGWCACTDGALAPDEYIQLLLAAGFENPRVELLPGSFAGGPAGVTAAHIQARRPE
ncbi:MAG: hypothetical protein CW349_10160 [Firmicutes bacterium]|nr:hypothetical protein [Bacillota bacterium]